MLYPSIDKLLNIVDSKYKLVHVASIRSKQMSEKNHYQMKENEYYNKKELGRALEEVEKGLITLKEKEIEIPKTKIKYPILEKVSKKGLETSVCIQYGKGLNIPGNTVIVGHNFRNGLFFSNNKKLSNGDSIYITDNLGQKVKYIIYNKYETTPEDTEYMLRNTDGKREISLSTCTDDSSKRTIIWAVAEEDK